MWIFNIIFSPVIALMCLLDYNNGKTFKENFREISAMDIEVEGPERNND